MLADLRERLARTRWPDQIPGTGWEYGTELAYLKQLCESWRTTYDWRKHEAALNRWPQFETTIDGQRLHFVHAKSKHADAFPLIVTHGWPGSIVEFQKLLPLLGSAGRARRLPRRLPLAARLRLQRARRTSAAGTRSASRAPRSS